MIGAERFERSLERTTRRNGSRPRNLSTKAGDIALRIPKLRSGSFFPSVLERRRRIDQALYAVVIEAYVHGVSTRKVDDLVAALGVDAGISKSEVSRICQASGHRARGVPHQRSRCGRLPLHLLGCHLREGPNHRSGGVASRGDRHWGSPLTATERSSALSVGDSEDAVFWTEFLRGPASARAQRRLARRDATRTWGSRPPSRRCFVGAAWQRCRVHFMRNVLAKVPRAEGPRFRCFRDLGKSQAH